MIIAMGYVNSLKIIHGTLKNDRRMPRMTRHTVMHWAIWKAAQRAISVTECERCHKQGVRLFRHHNDYGKPLDAEVLCGKCHAAAEKEKRMRQSEDNH